MFSKKLFGPVFVFFKTRSDKKAGQLAEAALEGLTVFLQEQCLVVLQWPDRYIILFQG
jgi:hypothetical protein